MFRSSEPPNPLDDIVVKATDENLTTENWEYILDVCDKVGDDPEDGSKNAVKAVSKRLESSNANVQLYALTLVSSLAQNCGTMMQRELASKGFVSLLVKLAESKTVHASVKSKIVLVMGDLTKQFASDKSLKAMGDAYEKIMKKNPRLQPPAVPQKQELSESERRKEEEELQMVLALSLSEAENAKSGGAGAGAQRHGGTAQDGGTVGASAGATAAEQAQADKIEQQKAAVASGKTAASVTRVRALYDLNSSEEGELSFRKGDVIHVIESVYRDWWRGSLRGSVGIFPLNYVVPLADATPEELAREAQDEVNVFGQSRNIEKLLAILSSTDSNAAMGIAEDEQLQNLYHSTLAVRPKLVKLIDKYSQKKDDLIQLNDKFISARKAYDELMERSLSQYRVASPRAPFQMPAPYGGPHRTPGAPLPYPEDAPAGGPGSRKSSAAGGPVPPGPAGPYGAPPSTGSPSNPYGAPQPSVSPNNPYRAPAQGSPNNPYRQQSLSSHPTGGAPGPGTPGAASAPLNPYHSGSGSNNPYRSSVSQPPSEPLQSAPSQPAPQAPQSPANAYPGYPPYGQSGSQSGSQYPDDGSRSGSIDGQFGAQSQSQAPQAPQTAQAPPVQAPSQPPHASAPPAQASQPQAQAQYGEAPAYAPPRYEGYNYPSQPDYSQSNYYPPAPATQAPPPPTSQGYST